MPEGTDLLTVARPRVLVDGVEHDGVAEALVGLEVRAALFEPTAVELALTDWGPRADGQVGPLWSDRELLDVGAALEVRAAGVTREEDAVLGAGRITGLRLERGPAAPPRWVAVAHDALWRLAGPARTRTFADASDVDVVGAVAAEHGLELEAEVDEDLVHPAVAQLGMDDLAFLRERAARLGAGLFLRGDVLWLRDAASEAEVVDLEVGTDVHTLSVGADLCGQVTAVEAVGHDAVAGARWRAEADDAPDPDEGLEPGPRLLFDRFGPRVALAEGVARGAAETERLARVELAACARRFATGTAEGGLDPRVRPGVLVRLRGAGEAFDGAYRVLVVRHAFDAASGWSTRFEFERATPGRARANRCGPDGPRPGGGKPHPGEDEPGKGKPDDAGRKDRPAKWERAGPWSGLLRRSKEDPR